jgi:hypothetical protein
MCQHCEFARLRRRDSANGHDGQISKAKGLFFSARDSHRTKQLQQGHCSLYASLCAERLLYRSHDRRIQQTIRVHRAVRWPGHRGCCRVLAREAQGVQERCGFLLRNLGSQRNRRVKYRLALKTCGGSGMPRVCTVWSRTHVLPEVLWDRRVRADLRVNDELHRRHKPRSSQHPHHADLVRY